MEWSWLKDWWRLKKLRRNNLARRCKNGSGGDENAEETGSSSYGDDDDVCFCDDCMNVSIFLYIYAIKHNYNNVKQIVSQCGLRLCLKW